MFSHLFVSCYSVGSLDYSFEKASRIFLRFTLISIFLFVYNELIGGFVYLNVWTDEFALIKLDVVSLSAAYAEEQSKATQTVNFMILYPL